MSTIHAVILYTSDLHGHVSPFKTRDHREVGGIAYLASAVEQIRESHPDEAIFWVDGGDSLANSTISDLTRGKPILDMMRKHGLKAMAVGNHEFDSTWGKGAIAEASGKAGFPFLGANIREGDGNLMPGVQASTVVEDRGIRAEILGATTPDTPQTTLPSNVAGLKFLSLEDTVTEYAPKIVRNHPHLKIMVVHAGPEQARAAATKAGDGWIVVGGHTDGQVETPINMGGSLYVKGGTYGENLGVLEVDVDSYTGHIVHYKNTFVPVGPGLQTPDPETLQSTKQVEAELAPLLDRVVGQTDSDLNRNHQGESLLDDLIADAMRRSAHADVAVRNSTATRADIPAGPIRVRDLYAVIPWEEPVLTVTMTRADFAQVLEHSVSTVPDPHVLQVSGLTVHYDRGRPEGHRVVDAVLDNGTALVEKGEIKDPDGFITVAARPFLVQGGLGYDAFKKSRDPRTGDIIRKAVEDHLKEPDVIQSLRTNRIQFES